MRMKQCVKFKDIYLSAMCIAVILNTTKLKNLAGLNLFLLNKLLKQVLVFKWSFLWKTSFLALQQ